MASPLVVSLSRERAADLGRAGRSELGESIYIGRKLQYGLSQGARLVDGKGFARSAARRKGSFHKCVLGPGGPKAESHFSATARGCWQARRHRPDVYAG